MKKLTFLILFFFSHYTLSQDKISPLNELSASETRTPYVMQLMIKHLSKYTTSSQKIEKTIGYCKLINKDLSKTPLANIIFLLKSEVHRGILESQYLSRKNMIQINESFLKGIEKKLSQFNLVYSEFSQWIIDSILKELSPYRKDQFILRYQSLGRTDFQGKKRAEKLMKSLSYVSAWLEIFDKYTPQKFNKLVNKVGIDILKQLSNKSYYFQKHSFGSAKKDLGDIFIVPNIDTTITSSENSTVPEKSLSEEQQAAKEKAQNTVENLKVDDMSATSKLIDKLPLNGSKTKRPWTPKD